ncbi:TetR/AcrR family transcriptional regulator [Streptomyces synnematoformans]|uniref:TetR/AcrR family transcriptional regulator n=1 Tax=Streptomyces synnematoformans TaxID=415721 RepID=UPI0031E27575
MADQGGTTAQPPRGRVAKRQAITTAARAVFGRDGYTRAGIEVIAAEAGVSTRTIYNHFDGKERLFAAVIEESSVQVAGALVRLIDDHLDPVAGAAGLEPALVALARAWAAVPRTEFAAHFAVVRQLQAEATHLPPALLEVWNDAGPRRTEAALARHLRALDGRGIVAVDDPVLAADHYLLLTLGALDARSDGGATPLGDAESARVITAGVRAFLGGYLPRPAP